MAENIKTRIPEILQKHECESNATQLADRLRYVLSSITEAYYALDEKDRFLELNPVAEEKLFRQSEEQLRGKVIWEQFPQGLQSHFPKYFQAARQQQQPVHFEAQSHICGRWFEAHAYPRDGRLEVYLRDITERKEAEGALKASREELHQLNCDLEKHIAERTARLCESVADLEAFSYSVSHDMRAPLRAMQGFAQMLREECAGQVGPTGQEYIARILTAAERMEKMILDLLALSRVSRAETHRRTVHLEKVIAEVLQQDTTLQQASIEAARTMPVLQATPALLTQVMSNLLSNAVKFVAPGVKPHVRIWAEPSRLGSVPADETGPLNNGTPAIRIWVEDNGIGLAPEDHERVFQIFERVHGEPSYAGTGIGLSIVRKAVERMGGRVGVQSELGQGSKFWIELPAE